MKIRMFFQKWVEPIVDKIDNNISYLMPSAFGVMRQFSAHTPPFKLTCKCISLANRYIHATSTYIYLDLHLSQGINHFFSQIELSWVGLSFGVVLALSLFFSCFVQTLEDNIFYLSWMFLFPNNFFQNEF